MATTSDWLNGLLPTKEIKEMPVKMKSSNYDFLQKLKVEGSVIADLKTNNIKLALGLHSVTFLGAQNTAIGTYTCASAVGSMLKYPDAYEQEGKKLMFFINQYVLPVHQGAQVSLAAVQELMKQQFPPLEKATVKVTFPPLQPTAGTMPSPPQQMPKSKYEFKAPQGLKPLYEKVALRDATAMYQQVAGTSPDSKYFVVAMNAQVKLAVQLKAGGLSLRAEGIMPPDVIKALGKAKLQVKGKGEYMSQHYSCDDNAPVSHLLGALLSATELEFDTPFPSVRKLKQLAGF
jgi:hypothetical protein